MLTQKLLILTVISYLMGMISPSAIIGRLHGIDIRKEGSGNAGATNTLRVLGGKAALITLIVDVGKGVLAVLMGAYFGGPTARLSCAFAVFVGHVFPIFMSFKGGKGVAVAFGVLLALDWRLALIMLAIVVGVVLISRRVSLGSIIAALVFPVLCTRFIPEFFTQGTLMAIIIFLKHKDNIARLLAGEEDKISLDWFKKKGVEK